MAPLDRLVIRRNQAIPRLMQQAKKNGLVQQPVKAIAGPWIRIRGHWLLNFAATNYLGLNHHPLALRAMSRAARVWGTSLGMPRLFAKDHLTTRLETTIATLVDQDRALIFPSTIHIALDVIPLLAGPKGILFVDEWAYPISLEGANAAVQRGAKLRRFPHNDHLSLAKLLQTHATIPDKVIVCDGVYPAEGRPAALSQIARLARGFDAVIYADDAHGVGVLGKNPSKATPYGYGGSGTACHLTVKPGNVVYVGSLSKAFGIPIAFVAGPARFIDYLRSTSATFTHSSPPSIPMLAAALGAVQVHKAQGDKLRLRLVNNVRYFRAGLTESGIMLTGNHLFPIQTLCFANPYVAEAVGRELRRRGIWPVLQFHPVEYPAGGVLRFVLTAHHRTTDLDRAIKTIYSVVCPE